MIMKNFIKSNNKDLHIEKSYCYNFKDKALIRVEKNVPVSSLLKMYEGSTFNEGMFKIHTLGSSFFWTEIVTTFFNQYKNSCYCFGFDWMGRQFAYHDKDGKTKILMFDCSTAEVFEIEQTIDVFFDEDLVDYINETLDTETFYAFKELNKIKNLSFKNCISYITPLFLGGEDNLQNLEVIDMEVNWEVNYQVYCKIKDLPDQTLIKSISLK